jgi:hypothetical protein
LGLPGEPNLNVPADNQLVLSGAAGVLVTALTGPANLVAANGTAGLKATGGNALVEATDQLAVVTGATAVTVTAADRRRRPLCRQLRGMRGGRRGRRSPAIDQPIASIADATGVLITTMRGDVWFNGARVTRPVKATSSPKLTTSWSWPVQQVSP